MKKSINVLITGIGGPTPRSLARALKSNKTVHNYYIVGVDCNHLAAGMYDKKYLDKTYLVPQFNKESYWDEINKIVKDEKIDLALVQPEIEVEGWALRMEKEDLPCPALLPPSKMITILKDKARMNEYLKDTSLIPKSIEISKNSYDTTEIEMKIGYPYWIRSTTGSSGLGSLKIDSSKKLDGWMLINDGVNNFTVSEFLPGRNLACKILFDNGKVLRAMCGERVNYIMAKIAPSGITGNTSFGRLLNYPRAIDISLDALKLISDRVAVTPNGLFTVDLKEDENGCPKITEINIRNVAFNSVFLEGGINIAEEMIFVTLGEQRRIKQPARHEFRVPLVFLRDVDCEPIVIPEDNLLS